MEMWLKRSAPVFLAVAVAAVVISGQEPVILDSVRTEVTHPLGSPLIFKCNLDTTRNQRVWVDWYFNPSGDLFNESTLLDPKNRSTKTSTAMPDKRKVDDKDDEQILYNHTLGAKYNDSGWYFCKVRKDIPILKDYVSNGTKVVITKSEEHSTHPSLTVKATESPIANFQLWYWIVLGVSAFVLIVLPVMCILLRRRWRRSREDPIYANTRPVLSKQPSPRPRIPADTLKTASSSQNLRDPSPKRYDDSTRRHRR
ncbi:uncharacterized protein LOC119028070 isoform X2 [Acanthopagrus latus]|uniref:uncharacterized protein LOC119028070 isoform X2 n=1 Tax=Acanthopagrus latus TaxID=8177 RepID=UPI00187CB2E2|nr:uncharacterized protein LOC119028070 isoform X2 [Acanthopagrus latus]